MLPVLLAAALASGAVPQPEPGAAEPVLAALFGPASGGVRFAETTTSWSSVNETVKRLRSGCKSAGGKLVMLGKANGPGDSQQVSVSGQPFAVSRQALWVIAGVKGLGFDILNRGRWMYDGFFDNPGIATAFKTKDPFGAYGCRIKDDYAWAASLMPGYRLPGGSNKLVIFELTPTFTKALTSYVKAEEEQRWRADQAYLNAARREREEVERQRAVEFRSRIAVGMQTNCGMILQMRGPIVEVQLPGGVTGPAGENQFWVRGDTLTGSPAPSGCSFGR